NLAAIVGRENVLSKADELLVYECDGLPQHKHRPRAVVFPSSTEETSVIMRELARAEVPFTPRGAGTGLSGGALALNSGVVIELARMRKILRIDAENRLAIVQPGVVNLHVSRAALPYGLYYVPDPSSQPSCTIGGNIAESAGGIHCLKYGTTTDHVVGCRVVLAGGEIVDLDGESDGYDLLGAYVGSEGTFGVTTEATLKLSQIPPAVRTLLAEFGEVDDASHAVSAIIAAGVMPAALEMMDREIIRAVEASVFAAGLPPDAGAALLIELDGIEAGLDDEARKVTSICMEYGARNCRLARDETERKKLWAARKGAFGAIGRISPDSMIQDAVVPRSRLPEVLRAAYDIAARNQLRIANVFHAGDGNLHPLICFDSRFEEQVKRVKEAGRELMEVCVNAGGTITGEHGVGLDKRELLPLVFSEADMNAMLSVRAAFDPLGLCNPGKIIPMLRGCGEGRAIATDDTETTDRCSPQPRDRFQSQRTDLSFQTSVKSVPSVAFPSSTEELAEIMKRAAGERWTVAPVGAKTLRHNPSTDVVIDTSRLDKILEHEPADLIAVAQAGVTLSTFNKRLSENGQWLPLDPPDDGRATLGGVVATGLGGAQQFGYGRPRGSVIGMTVVLADGNVIKAGGRVVKNVAGYDLCKLFTGSYGTLGIITELIFKLRPRPAREATIIGTGPISHLLAAGRAIINAGLFPVAVELVSSTLATRLDIKTEPAAAALLVRFAGNEKAVDYQLEQAVVHMKNCGIVSTEVLLADVQLWLSLAALPLQEPASFATRVLPTKVAEAISSFDREALWQAGLGDGRIRTADQAAPNAKRINALGQHIRQQLDPFNLFRGHEHEHAA
ncbi:MAG TPA: FAD-linked oxidase C-terminal domain-containing protein, partial [Pyrinomonadaceae bacterium]|nr:FAD-linked oxidase C-terminal domain-containing protein [Pyrinomonadaceae bacterium]